MKTKPLIIVTILFLVVGTIYCLYQCVNTKIEYDKSLQKVDSLLLINDSLNKKQLEYDSMITSYNTQIDLLDNKIDSAKQKINDLKKYYNEKIHSFNNYNSNQLDSFFTNRYK